MVGKTIEDVTRELLRARLHCTTIGDGVFAIRASSYNEDDHNNLEKISFKGSSDGSSDAAGKAELGERV